MEANNKDSLRYLLRVFLSGLVFCCGGKSYFIIHESSFHRRIAGKHSASRGRGSSCRRERNRKFGHLLVHPGYNRVSIPLIYLFVVSRCQHLVAFCHFERVQSLQSWSRTCPPPSSPRKVHNQHQKLASQQEVISLLVKTGQVVTFISSLEQLL